MILTPAGGGRRRHLLASNVWTKNLLSLRHKPRRCRLCRAGDGALLGLNVPSESAPGCNWGWAMVGEERDGQKGLGKLQISAIPYPAAKCPPGTRSPKSGAMW